MSHLDISNEHKEIIANLYSQTISTVDELPYTDEFDQLHAAFEARSGRKMSKHDFWRALLNSRKANRLVQKGRQ